MHTIIPSKENGKAAQKAHFDRTKKSISYLVRECGNKFELQADQLNTFSETIEKYMRFHPEVYYFHHRLQVSMRLQDISSAKSNLSTLMQVINENVNLSKWITVDSLRNSEWENFVVSEATRITNQDCGLEAEIQPITEYELSDSKDKLAAALYSIARSDPDMFDEIIEHVRVIKLFKGKATMGFTDARILGAMLIRLPRPNVDPVMYLLEHIVHEASHIHLNCVMAADSLVLNPPDELFASPLRLDPRPMIGVFHATFVSARVARVFMMIFKATANIELLQPLAESLDEALRGIEEINKYAQLSECGVDMVDSINLLLKEYIAMPEWQHYNFSEKRIHRFGAGETRVTELERAIASK